jgi:uncharacterized protein
MQPRLSMITLGVGDLEKSRKFFMDMGLPLKEMNDEIAFFLTSGTQLALYPKDKLAEDITISEEGTGFSGFTIAHNVKSKEEVRRVLQKAKNMGATIVKEAQDVFWGGYSGYFMDLDGYYWEIAWNPNLVID